MNRYWGRNDEALKVSLTQSDEFVSNLRFENILDSEYVDKLFSKEKSVENEHYYKQLNILRQKGSDWFPSADTPEEIIVFGDSLNLGAELVLKQLVFSVPRNILTPDKISLLLYRQAYLSQWYSKDLRKRKMLKVLSESINENKNELLIENVSQESLLISGKWMFCATSKYDVMKEIKRYLEIVWNMLIETRGTVLLENRSVSSEFFTSSIWKDVRVTLQYCFKTVLKFCEELLEVVEKTGVSLSTSKDAIQLKAYAKLLTKSLSLSVLIGLFACYSTDLIVSIAQIVKLQALQSKWKKLVASRLELSMCQERLLTDELRSILSARVQSKRPTVNQKDGESVIVKGKEKGKVALLVDAKKNPLKAMKQGSAKDLNGRNLEEREALEDTSVKDNVVLDSELDDWPADDSEVAVRNEISEYVDISKNKLPVAKLNVAAVKLSKSGNPLRKGTPEHPGALGSSRTIKLSDSVESLSLLEDRPGQKLDLQKSTELSDGIKIVSGEDFDDSEMHAFSVAESLKSVRKEIKNCVQLIEFVDSVFEWPKELLTFLLSPVLSINKLQLRDTCKSTENDMKSSVHVCGQNTYNELAISSDMTSEGYRKSFTLVENLHSHKFVQVGAGNEYTVFLTSEGKVFVVGCNDNGQCGVSSNSTVKEVREVAGLEDCKIAQIHVYNGCEHTLLISNKGDLFTFGYNIRGQLGLGTTLSENIPRVLKSLLSKRVIKAACSYYHSVILCDDGSVYSFGRGDSGQLGNGDTVDSKVPILVDTPKDVVQISCGQFYSILVTSQGSVYSCGKNDYGQLGISTLSEPFVKTFTKSNDVENIKLVSCGYYHTLLLSWTGLVYGCGRNDYGQLGLGQSTARVFKIQQTVELNDKNIRSVACGCYHSIAVSYSGMLYVFGRNNHGQLGTDDLDQRLLPYPVDSFVGRKILSVAAGFYHTVVVSAKINPDEVDNEECDSVFGVDKVSSTSRLLLGTRLSFRYDNGFLFETQERTLHRMNTEVESVALRSTDKSTTLSSSLSQRLQNNGKDINALTQKNDRKEKGITTTVKRNSLKKKPDRGDPNPDDNDVEKSPTAKDSQSSDISAFSVLDVSNPLYTLLKDFSVFSSVPHGMNINCKSSSFSHVLPILAHYLLVGLGSLRQSSNTIDSSFAQHFLMVLSEFLRVLRVEIVKLLENWNLQGWDAISETLGYNLRDCLKLWYIILESCVKSLRDCKQVFSSVLKSMNEWDYSADKPRDENLGSILDVVKDSVDESKSVKNILQILRNELIFSYKFVFGKEFQDLLSLFVQNSGFISEEALGVSKFFVSSESMLRAGIPNLLVSLFLENLELLYPDMNDFVDFFSQLSSECIVSLESQCYQSEGDEYNAEPNDTPAWNVHVKSTQALLYLLTQACSLFSNDTNVFNLLSDKKSIFILISKLLDVVQFLVVLFVRSKILGTYDSVLSMVKAQLFKLLSIANNALVSLIRVGYANFFAEVSEGNFSELGWSAIFALFSTGSNILSEYYDLCREYHAHDYRSLSPLSMKQEIFALVSNFYGFGEYGSLFSVGIPFVLSNSVADLITIDSISPGNSFPTADLIEEIRNKLNSSNILGRLEIYKKFMDILIPFERKLFLVQKEYSVLFVNSGGICHNQNEQFGRQTIKRSSGATTLSNNGENDGIADAKGPSESESSDCGEDLSSKSAFSPAWCAMLTRQCVIVNASIAAVLFLAPELLGNTKDISVHYVWKLVHPIEDNFSVKLLLSNEVASFAFGNFENVICALRKKVASKDMIYSMLRKVSGVGDVLLNIDYMEQLVFSTIIQLQFGALPVKPNSAQNFFLESAFQHVVNITKKIFSKRSDMVSNFQNRSLDWPEIVKFIRQVFTMVQSIFSRCSISFDVGVPLITHSRMKSKKFKRVICTVLCAIRWKNIWKYRLGSVGKIISSFYQLCFDDIFLCENNNLSCVSDMNEYVSKCFTQKVVEPLQSSIKSREYSSCGVKEFYKLMKESSNLAEYFGCSEILNSNKNDSGMLGSNCARYVGGARFDVLGLVVESFRLKAESVFFAQSAHQFDSARVDNKHQSGKSLIYASEARGTSINELVSQLPLCQSSTTRAEFDSFVVQIADLFAYELVEVGNSIVPDNILESLQVGNKNALSKINCAPLQLVAAVVKSLEFMSIFSFAVFSSLPFTKIFPVMKSLYMCCEKLSCDTNPMSDERGTGVEGMSTHSAYVMCAVLREKRKSLKNLLMNIVSVYETFSVITGITSNMLEYQNCGQLRAFLLLEAHNSAIACVSSPTILNESVEKDEKTGQGTLSRKKCQIIVSVPLTFSKAQEGYIIPEKSLIVNQKNTDFSIASWVYLSKKPTGKYGFLFGKAYQNDLWPVLVVRSSDMKLGLCYGKGSDLEVFVVDFTVPLCGWFHVAVTVEARRFKIFVNGVLSEQVASNGNPRAICMQLVLGNCANQIKNKAEVVKEGFEGQLGNLRYYTKSLVGVQVRLLFEHGSPEVFDVKGKCLFQLISSRYYLGETVLRNKYDFKCYGEILKDTLKQSSSVLLSLLISEFPSLSDTSYLGFGCNRIRSSSLKVLRQDLLMQSLTDINLPWRYIPPTIHCSASNMVSRTVSGNSDKSTEVSVPNNKERSLLQCSAVHDFNTFEEKFIAFLLRLAGLCWLPPLNNMVEYQHNFSSGSFNLGTSKISPAVLSAQFNCLLTSVGPLLNSSPTFLYENHGKGLETLVCSIQSSNPNLGAANIISMNYEKFLQRDELCSEFCHFVSVLIKELTQNDLWKLASSRVISCMLKNDMRVSAKDSFEDSIRQQMDLLGAAVVLGNISCGLYLGCSVKSHYCNSASRLISLNLGKGLASVLQFSKSTGCEQITSFQICDIVETDCDNNWSSYTLCLDKDCIRYIVDKFESLSSELLYLCGDFASIYRPDQIFMRKVYFKLLRPWEGFVCINILKYLISELDNMESFAAFLMLSKPKVVNYLIQYSSMVVHTQGIFDIQENYKSFLLLWSKNTKFLSLPYDVKPFLDPFAGENSVLFMEYAEKQLGLNFNREGDDNLGIPYNDFTLRLIKGGSIQELLLCCNEFSSNTSYINPEEYSFLVTDADSFNDWFAIDFECSLRLAYVLRSELVESYRKVLVKLLRRVSEVKFVSEISFTRRLLLLIELSFANSNMTTENNIIENVSEYLHKNERQSTSLKLSSCLASLACGFFTNAKARTVENFFEKSDINSKIVLVCHQWLKFNKNKETECEVCTDMLKNLLPSVSRCNGINMKKSIVQICRYLLHRMISIGLSSLPITQLLHHFNSMGMLENGEDDKENKLWSAINNSAMYNLIRSNALESLFKDKSDSLISSAKISQGLFNLVAGFGVMQRVASNETKTISLSRLGTMGIAEAIREIPITEPVVIEISYTVVDIDNSNLLNVVNEIMAKDDRFLSLGSPIIEIALGSSSVESKNSDDYFDVIYRGTCRNIAHLNLLPGCAYAVKSRLVWLGDYYSSWSKVVEFKTSMVKTPFTFDPLMCGPDILLGENGTSASYVGDDFWSTVLATQSFTSGTISWKIKVVQSSTAYLFIGIASSKADLNTFIGGCCNSWGFIGEQALYYNREKTKVYGDSFNSGDVVGVILDLNVGTLSFTVNGKSQGVAFDKIIGEFYPAVSFYNVGQEVEIVMDDFQASFANEASLVPFSSSYSQIENSSIAIELLTRMYDFKATWPAWIMEEMLTHINGYASGNLDVVITLSGKSVMLNSDVDSRLLKQLNIRVGERYRTPCGVGIVLGTAYGRVWFSLANNIYSEASTPSRLNGDDPGVWYYNLEQIEALKEKDLFLQCSYHKASKEMKSGRERMFDLASIKEVFEPGFWSEKMDDILISFLEKSAVSLSKNKVNNSYSSYYNNGCTPWDISADYLSSEFLIVQRKLASIVRNDLKLVKKWGITGPKRRAVIARVAFLRHLNLLLKDNLPTLVSSCPNLGIEYFDYGNEPFVVRPFSEFLPSAVSVMSSRTSPNSLSSEGDIPEMVKFDSHTVWPLFKLQWGFNLSISDSIADSSAIPGVPIMLACKRCLFSETKIKYFWELVDKYSLKAAKTDDDYDYPDDLPQVKLNRFKSFRAREASEFIGTPGEDMLFGSMFCQLWNELRQHSEDKLRLCYVHPMDDGQSRSFKVKFEAEGVDDYGGPYREIFQQICTELQCPDPSTFGPPKNGQSMSSFVPVSSGEQGMSKPFRCFLPLLIPTMNWFSEYNHDSSSDESSFDVKYTFNVNPNAKSDVFMELYRFLGQFIGIAIRSKITLALAFPSLIWKSLVREPMSEIDLLGIDIAAHDVICQIGTAYDKYLKLSVECENSSLNNSEATAAKEEILSLIQDIRWVCTKSDGTTVDLIEQGADKPLKTEEIPEYIRAYTLARLNESFAGIEAVRNGLLSVIPEESLVLLSGEELKNIVCGTSTIDVARLKENTEYDEDISPDEEYIKMFWDVLQSFSEKEKSAFLRFVWARPTLPPNHVEFVQKMKIQSSSSEDLTQNPDTFLPRAHTCFFSLNLPRYSSKEVMATKLRYAITHCTEMDADFKMTDAEVAGWGNATLSVSVPGNIR